MVSLKSKWIRKLILLIKNGKCNEPDNKASYYTVIFTIKSTSYIYIQYSSLLLLINGSPESIHETSRETKYGAKP